MKGPPLAARIRAEVADEVRELGGLKLVTVQVGEDPASTLYLRRKHEAAEEVGIASDDRKLPESTSEDELLSLVSELNEADEVVVGRSDIVGKPIAHLLLQANATVTLCHSRTTDLPRHTLEADVLVVAVGSPDVGTQ